MQEQENLGIIIYGFGIAGRWASDRLKNVIGFLDTDRKKWGKQYNGISVYSPRFFEEIDTTQILVVVSAVDIFDIIPLLRAYNVSSWESLSKYINLREPLLNRTGENDSFLEYSLRTVKNCHDAFLSDESLCIRSVDLVITEKCTLRCKDCANLMQFFEKPRNLEFNQVVDGIRKLASKCSFINEVRVIGGEPFINKQIYRILETILRIENIGSIVIYTNGMIPPKGEHASLLSHPKIHFSVTDYGALGKNTVKTISFLEANNISFRVHPPENWTDSGRFEYYERDDSDLKKIFADCCGKNLYTLVEDKLYRCPFAANADTLGAIPEDASNSVKVGSSKELVSRYVRDIEFLPACNFCPGRSFDAPEIIPAVQVKSPIPYKKMAMK